jgi:hypothetical protein
VLAAEQGYARAQFTLGTCFEVGRGVCRSYPNSVRWYQEAADQGFAAAQVLSLTVLWVLGAVMLRHLVLLTVSSALSGIYVCLFCESFVESLAYFFSGHP